jgi:probable FeS assembly SUF system protein SufT
LFRIAKEDAGLIAGYTPAAVSPSTGSGQTAFSEEAVWEVLKTCFDPEIPVNIVDLGLVYDLAVEQTPAGGHTIEMKMTLTAPGCGMGPVIAEDAKGKVLLVPGVAAADVRITWEPAWNQSMISEEGKMKLGLI